MTPKDIKRLVRTLRAEGVKEFHNGDLRIVLGDKPTKPRAVAAPEEQGTAIPTEEDMLYWSTQTPFEGKQ